MDSLASTSRSVLIFLLRIEYWLKLDYCLIWNCLVIFGIVRYSDVHKYVKCNYELLNIGIVRYSDVNLYIYFKK